MPNYDLGTARGKIRVDADTRGAGAADRALKAFERTISALAGKLGGFETSMNKIEAELKTAKRDFEQAERAADGFDRSISGADGSVKAFNIDVVELNKRMKGFHSIAKEIAPPLITGLKVLREYRNSAKDISVAESAMNRFLRAVEGGDFALAGMGKALTYNQNSLLRWTRTLHRAGGTAAVIAALTGRFTGMSRALAGVTGQQAGVLRLASGFRTLTFAVGVAGVFASRTNLAAKALSKLVDFAAPLDFAFKGLYKNLGNLLAPFDHLISKAVAAGPSLRNLATSARGVWNGLDQVAKGAVQFIGGVALMRAGVNGLITRFQFLTGLSPAIKAALGGALLVGPAVFQALGKSLQFVSNLLVGLLDAVKQLAGGFLALPGAISIAVAAFGTLKLITSGIKSVFKDLFKAKTPEDFAKAVEALPAAFKGVGQALADVLPRWKALSEGAARTFLSGAEDQIRKISDGALPVLEKSIGAVSNSWKIAKDQLVAFAAQGETLTAVNQISNITAQTMNQLSTNIQPALAGFRDIAIVGAQFIRDMTAGLPGIVDKFAAWASINRQNGNLMKWMQDAVRGVKDLVHGISDAVKAVWTLLTLFKTNNGDNFLDRFAASMKKFNETVQKSAAGGLLKQLSDAVKSVGTDRIKSLVDVFRSLGDALKEIIPFVTSVSKAFSSIMTPAIKLAAQMVESIFKLLNDLGAGTALGVILGLVGAFKLLGTILGPLRNIFQVFFGAFTGFKGAQNLILGAATALERFGPAGRKASNALLSVGDSVSKWATRIAGAAIVVTALWDAYSAGQDHIRSISSSLDDARKHADEFKDALTGAFTADAGTTGRNVFDTVKTQIGTMMDDLKTTGDQVPGIIDNIVAAFTPKERSRDNSFWGQRNPFAQTQEFNDAQKQAQDAHQADEAFKRLGKSTSDLASIATGSQGAFDQFTAVVRKSGDGGNEAADKLERMRSVFVSIQKDFEAAGPGGAKLAAGIKQIGDAAGDSQTKLQGLRTALEGLGLLQTSQYEAAFAYSEAIRGLGDAAKNAADQSLGFNDILNAGTNTLNTNSKQAQNLFNVLQPIGDKFLSLATQGGNVNQMWQDMQPQLSSTAEAFHLPIEAIQQLVGQMGAIPDVVNILVQLEGKDDVTKGIAQVLLFAQQNVGRGINIPILMPDAVDVEKELESKLGDIFNSDANSISFKANIDPASLPQIVNELAKHGISVDGAAIQPAKQAELPVGPKLGPPSPGAAPSAVGTGPVAPGAALAGPSAGGNPLTAVAPPAAQQVAEQVQQAKSAVDEMKKVLPDGKLQFAIIATGYDETVAVLNRVRDAITQVITEANKIPAAFATSLNAAGAILTAFNGTLINAGLSMMNSLAQGITAGTSSVTTAIEGVLKEIDARMPHSPPKKGPLAGSNYTDVAGKTLATDFAGGIITGYPVAGKAANGLMGQVASAMGGDTQFLGQFSQIIQFAQHMTDVFSKISETVLGFAKFISDPLGQGTFFGQSTGSAFGFERTTSRDQVAKQNAEKAPAAGTFGAGYTSDKALLSNIPASGRYSQTGDADLTKGLADCSSSVEDLVNIMDGAPTGGREMNTGNAATWLTAHGFKPGAGGAGDMRVAFNVNHMQATLPGGTNFNWGSDAAAARGGVGGTGANDPALNQRYYRPTANSTPIPVTPVDQTIHQGTGELPGPLDPTTQSLNTIADNTGQSATSQDQMLQQLRAGDPKLDAAIAAGQNPNSTDDQIASSLATIQGSIDSQNAANTPEAKQQAEALGGIKDSVMSQQGFSEKQNPVDAAGAAIGAGTSIASSIFKVLQSGIEAFGAGKDLVDMGLRYPKNSEDIMKGIDDVQKFIQLGADIAGAVSDVSSAIGSIVASGGGASGAPGGSGPGAIIQAIGQIAGLVQSALETTNAVIDLGQEAYRIAGTFIGPFLQMLAGAGGGSLQGNVKFLLDQNTGKLQTYSQDNPADKRFHNAPGLTQQADYQQAIGQVNVYGGPGSDPRDNTRQMMFQVRAAQMSGALAS